MNAIKCGVELNKRQRIKKALTYLFDGHDEKDSKFQIRSNSTMDLKSFITSTLTDIVQGIVDAQKNTKKDKAIINPIGLKYNSSKLTDQGYTVDGKVSQNIDFDLAITIETGVSASGNIKVTSGIFNVGTDGKIANQKNINNRIKFSVPILYPSHEDNKQSK